MADLKTQENDGDVHAFLDQVENEEKREDALAVLELMKRVTGEEPRMWGTSIVGLGHYHYKYASGREGDWFLTGFSPRKQNLTIYIMPGFDSFDAIMKKLGKFKTAKSCLYVKKLADIDMKTLETLVSRSVKRMKRMYG